MFRFVICSVDGTFILSEIEQLKTPGGLNVSGTVYFAAG